MSTVLDVITNALEMTGIKSGMMNLSGSDATAARKRINGILSRWNVDQQHSYAVGEINFPLVAAQQQYTIGSGGDFNTTRPIKIQDAFVRDSANVDYPVAIIGVEDWNSIAVKNITSDYPNYLWYNPVNPLGEINIYAVPSSTYTLYLNVLTGFTAYTSTGTTVVLPEGYEELLTLELAIGMCSYYGNPIPMQIKSDKYELQQTLGSVNFDLWMPPTRITAPSASNAMGGATSRTFIDSGI